MSVANQIINILLSSINSVLDFFSRILTAGNVSGLIISAFLIYTSTRFIMRPLFGSAGSDAAKILNQAKRDSQRRSDD